MKLTEAKLKQLIREVMTEGEGPKAYQTFQTECMSQSLKIQKIQMAL